MQESIEKELLLARVHYLEAIKDKPGSPAIHQNVVEKVKEYIKSGQVVTYMGVESLFNYLIEKMPDDESKADEYARELISFIDH